MQGPIRGRVRVRVGPSGMANPGLVPVLGDFAIDALRG